MRRVVWGITLLLGLGQATGCITLMSPDACFRPAKLPRTVVSIPNFLTAAGHLQIRSELSLDPMLGFIVYADQKRL